LKKLGQRLELAWRFIRRENIMKTRFNFKNIHHCEAVVLSCIDFRFWRETIKFIEEKFKIKDFDFPSLPGAAKAINESAGSDISFQCISVPVELHQAQKIIIINHEDCGAYGGSGKFGGDSIAEQKFHEKELKKAKKKILEKYPDREVILIYAKLADAKENIEFIQLD
jgi:carbonic anhydrase